MIPRVSVVIPVLNGEAYLREALRSVLGQSRPPDEVIVVDDGSTDRTGEIARKTAGVRYLLQGHGGQMRALNMGIAVAIGDFLSFLDADDRWVPEKLELQLGAFSAEPELDIVFGRARQFVERGARLAESDHERVLPARLPSAMLVRRDAFARVGPFSEDWPIGGVIEWCARADERRVRAKMLDEVVYERRVHGKNATLLHPNAEREYARMLKHVIDRRKAGAA
jgi:glycosyltransferase involved in cell wall biosynthesis